MVQHPHSLADKLIFPAPKPTYNREAFKKYLCWIPWNEAISPDKCGDDTYAEGIPCMWFPAPRAAGVMLFFHGNAEDLGMSFTFLRHMRDQFKVNVLACEYPGYGLLGSVASGEDALKEVVLTTFRFVVDELKVAYEQIIIFGRSIGSGPAVFLASRFPVGGLILVAAFASIKEVIRSLVGRMIAWAFTERFPNLAQIGNVSCPTLFIHGERDSLVPPSQTVSLFRRCRARKLLITPPNMEHNTNLFTDASYLAIPAINFFGLPGYQRDKPPQMPQQFFLDGRVRATMPGAPKKPPSKQEKVSNPWFYFCGCPTNHAMGSANGMSDIVALRPPGTSGSGRKEGFLEDIVPESMGADHRKFEGALQGLDIPSGPFGKDEVRDEDMSWRECSSRDGDVEDSAKAHSGVLDDAPIP